MLKATRLARVTENAAYRKWLGYELTGYIDEPDAMNWGQQLGRLAIPGQKLGQWMPIGELEASLSAYRQQLQSVRVPDVHYAPQSSNPYENVTHGSSGATFAVSSVMTEARGLVLTIAKLSGIRSRVIAWLHDFAARVYYEKVFSGWLRPSSSVTNSRSIRCSRNARPTR